MPRKIRISGEIGWTVTTADIISQLDSAKGQDLEIDIASPGGSVFDGVEIFNAIRDFKRNNPGSQIIVTIKGLAASMASYIAMVPAADMVVAEDNAVFMIHNPWNLAIGDYREMMKNAEFLQGLAELMGKAYVQKTGKTADEIAQMMDAETWLFGEELKAAGFVDDMQPAEDQTDNADSAAAIAAAQLRFHEMQDHAKERDELSEKPEKVAAVMRQVTGGTPKTEPPKTTNANAGVAGTQNNTPAPTGKGRKAMDLEQLQAEHPEVYAQAVAAGAKKEKERVAALMAMKADKRFAKLAAVQETLDECIKEGKSIDESNTLVMATLASPTVQAELDNPPDIDTGATDTATGETPRATGEREPVMEV